MTINAYAATEAKGELKPFAYDPGELGPDQVEIAVQTCGVCHSDLSMLDNAWHFSRYPFVPGHEAVGKVVALGENVKALREGDLVGIGWYSASCMTCDACMSGNHNLCTSNEATIVGRHGGFADRLRCHWAWATKIPATLDAAKAGPLFCGGITVFNPIVIAGVKPTDRVGVIGIGGLGHLALQFLNKWGCEVTAFSSNPEKTPELQALGAHNVVNSRDGDALKKIAGSLDFILCTANADLNWDAYLATLAKGGRLHLVGVVPKPLPIAAFPMIDGQKTVGGSPLGSPATTRKMIEFCGRHNIAPVTETFPMSRVNDAFQHLRDGKARYRIVLEADF
jgi:uncharacterized zinc-type alcohol dehydrogenase-like protein